MRLVIIFDLVGLLGFEKQVFSTKRRGENKNQDTDNGNDQDQTLGPSLYPRL